MKGGKRKLQQKLGKDKKKKNAKPKTCLQKWKAAKCARRPGLCPGGVDRADHRNVNMGCLNGEGGLSGTKTLKRRPAALAVLSQSGQLTAVQLEHTTIVRDGAGKIFGTAEYDDQFSKGSKKRKYVRINAGQLRTFPQDKTGRPYVLISNVVVTPADNKPGKRSMLAAWVPVDDAFPNLADQILKAARPVAKRLKQWRADDNKAAAAFEDSDSTGKFTRMRITGAEPPFEAAKVFTQPCMTTMADARYSYFFLKKAFKDYTFLSVDVMNPCLRGTVGSPADLISAKQAKYFYRLNGASVTIPLYGKRTSTFPSGPLSEYQTQQFEYGYVYPRTDSNGNPKDTNPVRRWGWLMRGVLQKVDTQPPKVKRDEKKIVPPVKTPELPPIPDGRPGPGDAVPPPPNSPGMPIREDN
jgi:hypothetical protein